MLLPKYKAQLEEQLNVLRLVPYNAEQTLFEILREYEHNEPKGSLICFPVPLNTPDFFVHAIGKINGQVVLLTYHRYDKFTDGLRLIQEQTIGNKHITEGNARLLHLQSPTVVQLVLRHLLDSQPTGKQVSISTSNTYLWCTAEDADFIAQKHG